MPLRGEMQKFPLTGMQSGNRAEGCGFQHCATDCCSGADWLDPATALNRSGVLTVVRLSVNPLTRGGQTTANWGAIRSK